MLKVRRSLLIGIVALVVVLFGVAGAAIGYASTLSDNTSNQTLMANKSYSEKDVAGTYTYNNGSYDWILVLYSDGTLYSPYLNSLDSAYYENSEWWVDGKILYYTFGNGTVSTMVVGDNALGMGPGYIWYKIG